MLQWLDYKNYLKKNRVFVTCNRNVYDDRNTDHRKWLKDVSAIEGTTFVRKIFFIGIFNTIYDYCCYKFIVTMQKEDSSKLRKNFYFCTEKET